MGRKRLRSSTESTIMETMMGTSSTTSIVTSLTYRRGRTWPPLESGPASAETDLADSSFATYGARVCTRDSRPSAESIKESTWQVALTRELLRMRREPMFRKKKHMHITAFSLAAPRLHERGLRARVRCICSSKARQPFSAKGSFRRAQVRDCNARPRCHSYHPPCNAPVDNVAAVSSESPDSIIYIEQSASASNHSHKIPTGRCRPQPAWRRSFHT